MSNLEEKYAREIAEKFSLDFEKVFKVIKNVKKCNCVNYFNILPLEIIEKIMFNCSKPETMIFSDWLRKGYHR